MKIRKIDENGDWRFGKGLADYATEEQAIEQNIKTRLLSWQGDCFFAPAEGIDWKNLLNPNQQANINLSVKGLILASYGVLGIEEVSSNFDFEDRKLSLDYKIDTIFSQGQTISGLVIGE